MAKKASSDKGMSSELAVIFFRVLAGASGHPANTFLFLRAKVRRIFLICKEMIEKLLNFQGCSYASSLFFLRMRREK